MRHYTKLALAKHEENVFSRSFCDKVRKKLNLRKVDLPDREIQKLTLIQNELIGEWMLNNPDGFELPKKRGLLVINKYTSWFFKNPDENAKMPTSIKRMIVSRHKKNLTQGTNSLPTNELSYLYNANWLNKEIDRFKKLKNYDFEFNPQQKIKIINKLFEGKQYFNWTNEDYE